MLMSHMCRMGHMGPISIGFVFVKREERQTDICFNIHNPVAICYRIYKGSILSFVSPVYW